MNLIKDHTLTSSQCLPPLPQHCKNAKWRFVSDKSLLCKNTKSTECWCKKELTVATNVHMYVYFFCDTHLDQESNEASINLSLSLLISLSQHNSVLTGYTAILFNQTQTDCLIWLRLVWSHPVLGLTLLMSPCTTHFIFTRTLSSHHAVMGLLIWGQWCEGHPSHWNYTAYSHYFS